MGLVGLCLGWGANQFMVSMLEKRAEQWAPAPFPKILPRHEEAKPGGPVEFAPGIIEEHYLPVEEEWVEGVAESDMPDDAQASSEGERVAPSKSAPSKSASSKSASSKSASSKDATPAKKTAAKQKPAVPTRVFTADRQALGAQFKNPSDLYAHGHYLPNEEDGVQRGLRFAKVAPGGVFARFGLRSGDIILSVNGAPLNNQNDVLANFENMRKMDVLKMRLERDGKALNHRYVFK